MTQTPDAAVVNGRKRTPRVKPNSVTAEASHTPTPTQETHMEVQATNGQDHTEAYVPEEPTETKVKRPRLPRFDENSVITVLKPDAKSGASAMRFNAYETGMTIKEYIAIMTTEPFNRTVGEVWNDIRWDTDPSRCLIYVGPTVVDVPPPPPPKEKKPRKSKPKAEEVLEAEPPTAA